ncbi:MAG: glycosyltransferase [Candidatus Daviesbacteria bacterium]|nr:glycosyltransferase [Candidatus Daviesbacteria bacterium]
MKVLVSIIVTTKNSVYTIDDFLKSIKKQTFKNIEIILVDNSSSDSTVEITKKYTKKVFIKGPERSAQRNYGVSKSIGDFVLILDSDMVLTKDVVKECAELALIDKKIGGIIIPEKSFGSNFWAKVKAFEREINEGEGYFEAARFFPKKVFQEFQGYDENLTGPEDWDLPQRISKKYKISRIKSYILHNEGKTSVINLMKKKYYYGLSADKYLSKQKMSPISSKTLYFLRPAFYRNWKKLLSCPTLTLAMILMLTLEMIGGGWGYLIGKFRK